MAINELKRIDDFRRVLTDYRPSEAAREALKPVRLIMLVGPTSSGKNTIVGELLRTGRYHYVVSDTTRQPRENQGVMEQNGREYWFRSEDEMLADLEAGQFLEAAIIHDQQVSGTSIRELLSAEEEGKPALHEIDYIGADIVHATKPDARFIFIVPPSFDEWMVRMRGRGELPADETRRRLESATKEIRTALDSDFYYFLVNDTYVHAAKRIDEMALSGEYDRDAEKLARDNARQVLAETQEYLSSNL
jgi:guanylate kinase